MDNGGGRDGRGEGRIWCSILVLSFFLVLSFHFSFNLLG